MLRLGRLRARTFGLALAFVVTLGARASEAQSSVVILATTTSTQDSGLLDVLVPLFTQKTGYTVKPIAVGTGQSLALGARGEADVVLVHAPELERKYLAEGSLINRRLVMHNDFVLAGPPDDPARIEGMQEAAAAFRKIAESGARFVSRGDRSGTHEKELSLWRAAATTLAGDWYIESGQGMGATLTIASERGAYTLTDRATYLAFKKRVALTILLEGDARLLNIYHVMEVNSAGHPRVNVAGGRAFAHFVVSPEAQAIIRTFGVDKF
ncbi:MAG: substrate-binding domain-containing protein, partial [Acidimicrobiia bacterium]